MSKRRFRVWIAGPRGWEAEEPIERVIAKLESKFGIGGLLLITGGATGVDHLVEEIANRRGVHCVRVRACWPVGRQAGPIRNNLISEELDPDLLVALYYYELIPTNHRGTQNAIKQAKKRSIPVRKIRVSSSVALPSSVSDESPMGTRARERHGAPPRQKPARKRRKPPGKP